jgi:hypothetical protein
MEALVAELGRSLCLGLRALGGPAGQCYDPAAIRSMGYGCLGGLAVLAAAAVATLRARLA